MRKFLLFAFLFITFAAHSQQLTVEKIMQDTKWIGSSPSGIFWSPNSKSVLFRWNPDKKIADSAYGYTLNMQQPVQWGYNDWQAAQAASGGVYNKARTQLVYEWKGDIYPRLRNRVNERKIE